MTSEGKSSRAAGSSPKPVVKKGQKHRSGGGLFALDRETSARLMLFGAATLIVAIAAGVIGIGYYVSVVKPRSRTVLQVDSTKISYDAMVRRMAYEYFQNVNYQKNSQLLAGGTYQTLLDELTKIDRGPSDLGVVVTPQEFDTKFRARIGAAPDADSKTVADALKAALAASGLTETEYRRVVQAELVDAKIKAKYKAEAPANTLQAKVEVILTTTQDAATAAIARIKAGEDFTAVAKEVSKETDVATTGGVHPYGIKGTLNSAWEDYAWSADIGKLSDPLASKATTGGFYVVEVLDRSDQPVTDAQSTTIAAQKESAWLKTTQDAMQASGALKTDFNVQSQNDALNAVGNKVAPKARATQSAQQRQQITQATAIAALTAHPATPGGAPTAVVTIDTGATPAANAPNQNQQTPVAPSQPVAPGSNGP